MTRSKAVTVPEIEQAEAAIASMATQSAPMVQRLASHRDRVDMIIRELEGERFELLSRRELLRRQVEAVEAGLEMHIQDVENTLRLYEGGIGSLPADGSRGDRT